jgi:hypothetical protein
MQKTNNPVPEEDVVSEERQRLEAERQKLVAQIVKLPNGARFTRLKPVTA